MKKYHIHNKSSENMSEVSDKSVDIIIFSPPYNISTKYDEKDDYDHKNFEDFKKLLANVAKESARVLKTGGVMLVEAADSVYSDNKFIALCGLIQKLCLEAGLQLRERHIDFISSDGGVEKQDREHNWSDDYYSTENAHSVCHQWMIFVNGDTKFEFEKGKVFYVNYPTGGGDDHPCPFSPEHVETFLSLTGFSSGKVVLDPFMGTARMGEEVLKRGGEYIGYEVSESHCKNAEKRLGGVK